MATQRTSFAKLQRERDRQARAAAKRDRRKLETVPGAEPEELLGEIPETLSASELLKRVEAVHLQFDAGEIDFEAFEETKRTLLSRLPID